MRGWDAARVARAAGAELTVHPQVTGGDPGPSRPSIDSRSVAAGELFVGLHGERADGGRFALQALEAGAWGVLVAPEHARAAAEAGARAAVLAHPDPLAGLQALARAWQRELRAGGTRVVAITGSTGKTSTKDILAAILSSRSTPGDPAGERAATVGGGGRHPHAGLRTVVSPDNLNTEIGLPLAVLAAPRDTDVLVLEMAMRGAGQIAELTAIAEPDVGVIVNIGPAHLEQLGSLEAIAAAKAELIAGLACGATAVVPADEPLLARHLRADVRTIGFGNGGEVRFSGRRPGAEAIAARADVTEAQAEVEVGDAREDRAEVEVELLTGGGGRSGGEQSGVERITLLPSFRQAHNMRNLLAAVAAARALGVTPEGRVDARFSALRGERVTLPGGVVLIDDCYNANPMSMRAAIDDLAETARGRRVAVLGDMLELGRSASRFHREIGEHAGARGVELLLTVGPLAAGMRAAFAGEAHSVADAQAAAELLRTLVRRGDTVLVKGSRGVGLELVARTLASASGLVSEISAGAAVAAPSAGSGRR